MAVLLQLVGEGQFPRGRVRTVSPPSESMSLKWKWGGYRCWDSALMERVVKIFRMIGAEQI